MGALGGYEDTKKVAVYGRRPGCSEQAFVIIPRGVVARQRRRRKDTNISQCDECKGRANDNQTKFHDVNHVHV